LLGDREGNAAEAEMMLASSKISDHARAAPQAMRRMRVGAGPNTAAFIKPSVMPSSPVLCGRSRISERRRRSPLRSRRSGRSSARSARHCFCTNEPICRAREILGLGEIGPATRRKSAISIGQRLAAVKTGRVSFTVAIDRRPMRSGPRTVGEHHHPAPRAGRRPSDRVVARGDRIDAAVKNCISAAAEARCAAACSICRRPPSSRCAMPRGSSRHFRRTARGSLPSSGGNAGEFAARETPAEPEGASRPLAQHIEHDRLLRRRAGGSFHGQDHRCSTQINIRVRCSVPLSYWNARAENADNRALFSLAFSLRFPHLL